MLNTFNEKVLLTTVTTFGDVSETNTFITKWYNG